MSAVGSDVESLCSKCGDVWHVVVAKVGDKIAKVQCKECGAYHRHRAPGGTAKGPSTPRRRSSSAGSSSTRATSTPKPSVDADMSRPIRPYSPGDQYEVGERVEHPKFGIGVVQSANPGKVEVFFGSFGPRVLAQAKSSAPKLTRPTTRFE